MVNVDIQRKHPVLSYWSDESPRILPSLTLISPEGGAIPIPIQLSGDEPDSSLKEALRRIVSTPFRDELVHQLARHYAAVLLIEGPDAVENQRALRAVKKAIAAVQHQMKFMPKPVNRGPVVIEIGENRLPSEGILLWALGIADSAESGPYAAVLYGKARWIGPLLRSSEIEEKSLLYLLTIIGADCECGLDPRLIRGRPLPTSWDREVQSDVIRDLGFDPENPLVRIEVSQIMRMRASLYPDYLVNRSSSQEDNLPVPYVDDTLSPQSASFLLDPVLMSVLYSLVGISVVAVFIGILIMRRSDS